MKYWQWSSDRSWVRMTLCMSVSMSSCFELVETSSRAHVRADLNQVDLCKGLVVPRLLDVKNGNDVLMIEIS